MNAERIRIAEFVLDLVGELNDEAAAYRRRIDELRTQDGMLPVFILLSRNYRDHFSLHCKLICGYTRSYYRNKEFRKFAVRIKSEAIAKETGASVETVESYLLAHLEGFL